MLDACSNRDKEFVFQFWLYLCDDLLHKPGLDSQQYDISFFYRFAIIKHCCNARANLDKTVKRLLRMGSNGKA